MRLRRLAVLGCLAVALASAAGCGLSVDALPQPIPSDEVPPALRCRRRPWSTRASTAE